VRPPRAGRPKSLSGLPAAIQAEGVVSPAALRSTPRQRDGAQTADRLTGVDGDDGWRRLPNPYRDRVAPTQKQDQATTA